MGIEETPIDKINNDDERIKNVLERAMALYKENPEKGKVRITSHMTISDPYEEKREDRSYTIQIAKIDGDDAVAPNGRIISLCDIDDAELVDGA